MSDLYYYCSNFASQWNVQIPLNSTKIEFVIWFEIRFGVDWFRAVKSLTKPHYQYWSRRPIEQCQCQWQWIFMNLINLSNSAEINPNSNTFPILNLGRFIFVSRTHLSWRRYARPAIWKIDLQIAHTCLRTQKCWKKMWGN